MSASRSQTKILIQLTRYLKLKDTESAPWIPSLINELKGEGHCFGFAICDATMHLIGKKEWWLKVKGLIADWDGTEAALKKPHPLQDADKKESLEALFERMLDYVVINYAISGLNKEYPFFPGPDDQAFFLKPSAFLEKLKKDPQHSMLKAFELSLDKKREILDCASVGGHFEKETLVALLKQNISTIAESICLIRGNNHSSALCTDNENWYFYDSNNTTGDARVFSHDKTDELVDLIQTIHSKNMGIECASFRSEKIQLNTKAISCCHLATTQQDEKYNTDVALSRLDETGLHRMAQHCWPDANELIGLCNAAKTNAKLSSALAKALITQNSNQSTGLHIMACYAPGAVPALIELAKTNAEIQESLAKTLLTQNHDQLTGLQMLACHTPHAIPELIDLAKTSTPARENLAKALSSQNSNRSTGLHLLARSTPFAIPALIEIAKTDKKIRESLAEALVVQNSCKATGLHVLVRWAPFTIPALIELAKTDVAIQKNISNALNIKNNDNMTPDKLLGCLLQISPQEDLDTKQFLQSNSKNDRKIVVKIIGHSISHATTPEEVRSIIDIAHQIPCLHHAHGLLMPKLRHHMWHSDSISHALAKLIEQAKQKIIDLCPCEPEGHEENIKFLGENTSYSQKDWVKLYKEKQPSCQSEMGMKLK